MHKNLFAASILLVLLASPFKAGAKTQPSTNWTSRLIGSYRSEILNKSTVMPGKTAFSKDKRGGIFGSYTIDEGNQTVSGKLSECKTVRLLTLRCRWSDKYGTGGLEMTFSKDFSRFNGLWGEEGLSERYVWNGTKN